MPPSDREEYVSHTIPGYPAFLPVNGLTGVPSVMGSTQGRHVITTAVTPDNNFFPLPRGVVTPIITCHLRQLAAFYPHRQLLDYILDGFTNGFDIGFQGSFNDPNTRPRNLRSAALYEEQVDLAVHREISRGHTSGPFSSQPFQRTHCSPIGAAPKPDGSIRLILDLASPQGPPSTRGFLKRILGALILNLMMPFS